MRKNFFIGCVLVVILAVGLFFFFNAQKSICTTMRDPSGMPSEVCTLNIPSPYQRFLIMQHKYFFPNDTCTISIETGALDCRSFPTSGCDQSATTTDCSRLTPLGTPYTPPPKEESPATTTQPERIDEHLTIDNTLRGVSFCGISYQTKQVLVDGVDVIRRIAALVTASNLDYMKGICDRAEGLRRNGWLNLDKDEIGVSPVIRDASTTADVYRMSLVSPTGNFQPIGDFKVNVSTKEITILLPGFADVSEKPIGKLK